MPCLYETVQLGQEFQILYDEIGLWSQATFGTDQERGPIGSLKHLSKEALEAAADPGDVNEYADCLILILDASRRAGISARALVDAGHAKMKVNRSRVYPRPGKDEVSEHVR